MAQSKPKLTVQVAPDAAAELAEIWRWNAENYSPDQADRYVAFLKQVIFGLDRLYWHGTTIDDCPGLRYVLIRRKRKRHGHIAVYRVSDSTVDVFMSSILPRI